MPVLYTILNKEFTISAKKVLKTLHSWHISHYSEAEQVALLTQQNVFSPVTSYSPIVHKGETKENPYNPELSIIVIQ